MTENKNVILSARDIVVEFDVRDRVLTAIRGVSLDLVEGEVLALVGESGSGKSVLTKTFTGMLEENGRVASGSIDYRGQDLTKLKSHQDWAAIRGAKIATIFQDPMTSLDPIKTIGSQIVEVIVKHQEKLKKWPLITWTRLVFLMLKNVSTNILSNTLVGCVNVSSLPLPWLVVLMSLSVTSQQLPLM